MGSVKKIRFVEPGNPAYKRSIWNWCTYDRYLRNPSVGMLTLATRVKSRYPDTLMYSESISQVIWEDVLDADVVFIGIFTFNANRGYALADKIKKESKATVVMGGLHASLAPKEAALHCDYVLMGEAEESILTFLEGMEEQSPPQEEQSPPQEDQSLFQMDGVAYFRQGEYIQNRKAKPPWDLDLIPDRSLIYRYQKMAGHQVLWPQVHASRGCPHHCDYCAVVKHFGHEIRKRTPENVVQDIRESIAFHQRGRLPRVSKVLWLTDDNFFADRDWAKSVLEAIIASGVIYHFTVQARYETGFDDEMLELLKKAGFIEIAMGIEFVDDASFAKYHKRCTVREMEAAIKNTQRHGISVRGLFIVGTEEHEKGVGKQIADFVIRNQIKGVLIQSMYFVPGTLAYETHKDKLLFDHWQRCNGSVVHMPANMTPLELQKEIMDAILRLYSLRRLLAGLFREKPVFKVLLFGEFLWQRNVRRRLKRELPSLEPFGRTQPAGATTPSE